MTAGAVRVSSEWLALREPADAAARARELVERLRRGPARTDRWLIHDFGCGTGAMSRWLAPLLPGHQHWVLHDRDPDLLEIAASEQPRRGVDGAAVTLEVRKSDITRLGPSDLAGATLITASALLDMLTAEEFTRLTTACAGARCPILLTLSVIGRVELTPAEPLDSRLAAAFDAHQRRATEGGCLLGPDAVALAARRFGRLGAEVALSPSPWRLGVEQSDLLVEWLTGWVDAACEQSPELTPKAGVYMRRRLAQAAAGELQVTVGHADLLVSPRTSRAAGHPPRRADRRRRRSVPTEEQTMSKTTTREHLIQTYRKSAHRYDITSQLYFPQQIHRRRALHALGLRPGDTVVEIACGTGLNFPMIEQEIGPEGRIVGVDLTDAMLAQAQHRIETNGWSNVSLVHADAAEFEFPTGVDAILATYPHALLPASGQVIAGGAAALRPGGRWAVLDLKVPDNTPRWLARLAIATVGRSRSLEEWIVHRPWEAIRVAMQETLIDVSWTELFSGIAYLAVGTRDPGIVDEQLQANPDGINGRYA